MHYSSTNWRDIETFLHTVRNGSARATAEKLGISHSTVSRRINSLESSLKVRLFSKEATGYKLTPDGEFLMGFAEQAEYQLIKAQRSLLGKDQALRGIIRITAPDAIANYLLMTEVASFKDHYPDIDIQLLITSQVLDIAKQEAEIALRILLSNQAPPDNLVGRMVGKIASCFYCTREYLDRYKPWEKRSTAKVLGWGKIGRVPDWLKHSPLNHLALSCQMDQAATQVAAAKSGAGIAMLPCFIAESEPDLVRVKTCEPEIKHDLWMLSHPEQREVARLRAFKERLVTSLEQQKDKLLGL